MYTISFKRHLVRVIPLTQALKEKKKKTTNKISSQEAYLSLVEGRNKTMTREMERKGLFRVIFKILSQDLVREKIIYHCLNIS